MIVAHTNVISELMKGESSPIVRKWLAKQDHHTLRITAITVAEILSGIEQLPNGKRKIVLREAARAVFDRFADDVLPFAALQPLFTPKLSITVIDRECQSVATTLKSRPSVEFMARD